MNIIHSIVYPFRDTWEIISNRIRELEWLRERTLENGYGNPWSFQFIGLPTVVVITHPDDIRHILHAADRNYVKGERFHSIFYDILGDGIFNTDGSNWFHQRKAASHLFTTRQLYDRMAIIFKKHSTRIGDRLNERTIVDIQEYMFEYTFQSFIEVIFGIQHTLPNEQLQSHFDFAQRVIQNRLYRPLVWNVCKLLRIGEEGRLSESIRYIHDWVDNRLHERRSRQSHHSDDHYGLGDLIDYIYRYDNTQSDESVRTMVINMLIAGRDTTACLLSWAIYHIAIDHTIGVKLRDRELSDSSSDDYMNAFLYEVLRMHPPVAKDIRCAKNDDVLPHTSHPIQAGTWICYSPWVSGRNPDIWGDDVDVFRPERWLERASHQDQIYTPSSYEFPVFNGGPRLCLGKQMALLESRIMLQTLVSRYEFQLVSNNVKYDPTSITHCIQNGLYVMLYNRESMGFPCVKTPQNI